MEKYIKKPVEIEAIQLEHSTTSQAAIIAWSGGAIRKGLDGGLIIPTLEGDMVANTGAYIIKGVQGEFYPCKEDIFHATYDPVVIEKPKRKGITVEEREARAAEYARPTRCTTAEATQSIRDLANAMRGGNMCGGGDEDVAQGVIHIGPGTPAGSMVIANEEWPEPERRLEFIKELQETATELYTPQEAVDLAAKAPQPEYMAGLGARLRQPDSMQRLLTTTLCRNSFIMWQQRVDMYLRGLWRLWHRRCPECNNEKMAGYTCGSCGHIRTAPERIYNHKPTRRQVWANWKDAIQLWRK